MQSTRNLNAQINKVIKWKAYTLLTVNKIVIHNITVVWWYVCCGCNVLVPKVLPKTFTVENKQHFQSPVRLYFMLSDIPRIGMPSGKRCFRLWKGQRSKSTLSSWKDEAFFFFSLKYLLENLYIKCICFPCWNEPTFGVVYQPSI